MPVDSLIVVTAVSITFLLFALVLARTDRSTTRWVREKGQQAPSSPQKKAA